MVLKIAITMGFFAVAFFFSAMLNMAVHVMLSPTPASYVIAALQAAQILLILYATGFMDIVRRVKRKY